MTRKLQDPAGFTPLQALEGTSRRDVPSRVFRGVGRPNTVSGAKPSDVPDRLVTGFTFLEVLVSAFILALVSTIILLGAAAGRRNAIVRSSAQQIAGFLRETGGLALNGVKAANCDPANVDCSRYLVIFGPSGRKSEYVRRAVGGGTEVRSVLPAGAVFPVTEQEVRFAYTPPTLTATAAAIALEHTTGVPRWWVCVTSLGGVEVHTGSCPP
ncbi:MAG: hypothetical protein G01um101438_245 [Parcubacteria group bacterium Gr01-1014_38]|nr:MAG: hypothetical protein G01um101438_245 [Parcubacteria group bacterium Gr01-1014_38]